MKTYTLKPGALTMPKIEIQLTPEDLRRGGQGVYEAKLRVSFPDGSHQFVTERFRVIVMGEK